MISNPIWRARQNTSNSTTRVHKVSPASVGQLHVGNKKNTPIGQMFRITTTIPWPGVWIQFLISLWEKTIPRWPSLVWKPIGHVRKAELSVILAFCSTCSCNHIVWRLFNYRYGRSVVQYCTGFFFVFSMLQYVHATMIHRDLPSYLVGSSSPLSNQVSSSHDLHHPLPFRPQGLGVSKSKKRFSPSNRRFIRSWGGSQAQVRASSLILSSPEEGTVSQ